MYYVQQASCQYEKSLNCFCYNQVLQNTWSESKTKIETGSKLFDLFCDFEKHENILARVNIKYQGLKDMLEN